MKISSLIIAIFIFVGMSAGCYSFYYEFVTPYSNAGLTTPPISSTLSSYNSPSLNNIHAMVNDISNIILNVNPAVNFGAIVIGMGILFLRIIVALVTLPSLIFNVLVDLLNVTSVIAPIPGWFIDMISVVIMTYVIFRLASTVLGGRDL